MSKHDCVLIKLYLWTAKFEFHIILMHDEVAIQIQVAGWFWPVGYSFLTPSLAKGLDQLASQYSLRLVPTAQPR